MKPAFPCVTMYFCSRVIWLSAVMTDSMEANLNHGSHWDIMREYALKSIQPPRSDGWNRTRLRFLWIFLR